MAARHTGPQASKHLLMLNPTLPLQQVHCIRPSQLHVCPITFRPGMPAADVRLPGEGRIVSNGCNALQHLQQEAHAAVARGALEGATAAAAVRGDGFAADAYAARPRVHSWTVPSQKEGMRALRWRQRKRLSLMAMQRWSGLQHGSTLSKPLPPHWRLVRTHSSEVDAQGLALMRHSLPSTSEASATAEAMARAVAISMRSSTANWKSVTKSSALPTAGEHRSQGMATWHIARGCMLRWIMHAEEIARERLVSVYRNMFGTDPLAQYQTSC